MRFTLFILTYACINNRVESIETNQKLTLELIQVLFRHGERTPLDSEYKTYNYTDLSVYQPYGLGQLTNNGKHQAFNLGRRLRQRYENFLSTDHKSNETCSHTSENERTKMTLQLALAGLYQPPGTTWRPDLEWTPVPFRVIPQRWDVLLKPNFNPKFMSIWRQSERTPEHRALIARHSRILDFLQEKTGVKIDRAGGLQFAQIDCLIHSHERMNISLPDWYSDDMKADFAKVMESVLDCLSFTPEMKRINGGTIVRQFLRNANAEAISAKPKKLYLYSGHDINIAAVQRSLGVKDTIYPDFAGSLIFETYRNSDDRRVYVRILYWDSVENRETALKIDKCAEFCPIGDFAKIVNDVLPSEEELKEFTGEADIGKINGLYGACEN